MNTNGKFHNLMEVITGFLIMITRSGHFDSKLESNDKMTDPVLAYPVPNIFF